MNGSEHVFGQIPVPIFIPAPHVRVNPWALQTELQGVVVEISIGQPFIPLMSSGDIEGADVMEGLSNMVPLHLGIHLVLLWQF